MDTKCIKICENAVVCLTILALSALLISALTFTKHQTLHKPFLIASIVLFSLVAIIIIVAKVVEFIEENRLSEDEEKALMYLMSLPHKYVRSEVFIMMFGLDMYKNLLKKDLIEYYLVDKVQEVHCIISKMGFELCNKKIAKNEKK